MRPAPPLRHGEEVAGSRAAGRRAERMGWLWLAALLLAVVGILAFAALSYRALRSSGDAWDRLLDTQVADLVEAQRLAAASEVGARLVREAVLGGDPRVFRALGRNRAEQLDLLDRARRRARTLEDAALVAAIAADADRIWAAGERLVDARLAGEPPGRVVARLESEIRPVRDRIDDALAQHTRAHEADLARGRREIDDQEFRARRALLTASGAGVALALLLGVSLRRSLGALSRSEARFRATFEQAAVGIAHVSLHGTWLRLNSRYQELLGRDDAELRGVTFLEPTHPEDREADAVHTERLRAGEIPGFALEQRLVRPDGGALWVNVTCALVRDWAGRPAYFVRAAEDISARKKIEHDLRDAVRTRDEFLQVASHELRTPLATLRLKLEGVLAALARGATDPERLGGKAESALRQTSKLARLVDELLDVSRLAEGPLVLAPAEVDLVELARGAIARFSGAAAREGDQLRLHAAGSVVACVDAARFEQALGHLLSNAVRYGGGKPVDVTVEADGGMARVAVADHGIGIRPEDEERIFGRFERAASWRHYGGLGLGLFLTRRIVEAHGGAIELEATGEQGATFVMTLPVEGPPEAEPPRGHREAGERAGAAPPGPFDA